MLESIFGHETMRLFDQLVLNVQHALVDYENLFYKNLVLFNSRKDGKRSHSTQKIRFERSYFVCALEK